MKKKLHDFDFELVNGGLIITDNIKNESTYYNVDENQDVKKLWSEFRKSHQDRDIDATYYEYKTLVDIGVIPKDPIAYEYACTMLSK